MSSLPEDIIKILNTLEEICNETDEKHYVELIQNANIDIRESVYDNWNGGTYGYTIELKVPITLFVGIKNDIEEYEEDLINKLKPLIRSYDNEYIDKIIISPKLIEEISKNITKKITNVEKITFWEKGYFRLFLSHVAKYKKDISDLQKELYKYAISAFVAHKDIEPTKEWQDEIESALSTMNAMVAYLTDGFRESQWCDQEVGVAIGRNLLIIPIRAGNDPHGFIGKFQGVTANSKSFDMLAKEIFEILLKNTRTKESLSMSIIEKLSNSKSYQESNDTSKLLDDISDNINQMMLKKLADAIKNNGQVSGAYTASDKINSLLIKYKKMATDG